MNVQDYIVMSTQAVCLLSPLSPIEQQYVPSSVTEPFWWFSLTICLPLSTYRPLSGLFVTGTLLGERNSAVELPLPLQHPMSVVTQSKLCCSSCAKVMVELGLNTSPLSSKTGPEPIKNMKEAVNCLLQPSEYWHWSYSLIIVGTSHCMHQLFRTQII